MRTLRSLALAALLCLAPAAAWAQATGYYPLVFITPPNPQQIPANTPLLLRPSTTSGASLRIPHGSAPTTPVNGDVWTTTSGLYAYINGVTIGPFGTGGGSVTTLSVVTAHGFSGSVANPTTTPAITISAATQTAGDDSTNVATTAYVDQAKTWSTAQTFGEVHTNTITDSSSARTLSAGDCGATIIFTDNAAVTVTIPATLPVKCGIAMEQQGYATAAGVSLTGSAVTPATLHKAFTNGTTRVQYSVIGITVESNSGGSSAVAVMWGDGA